MTKPLAFQSPTGLYTDPSPFGPAPSGALTQASNVVLRRAGTLEPRPSFDSFDFTSPPVGYTLRRILPWGRDTANSLLIGKTSGLEWLATWRASQLDCVLPADGETFRINWQRSTMARGHMYLATAGRVVRVREAGATSATALSSPPLTIRGSTIGATTGVVQPDTAIAIRAIVVRTLEGTATADEFVTMTQPTVRFVVENEFTNARDVNVVISGLGGLSVGDVVEIYRSKSISMAPSDELFLARSEVLDSGDIASGAISVDLRLPDDELGRVLYTSPSQEGWEQANYAPPSCRDLALFRSSVFYANTTEPHEVLLEHASYEGPATTGSATQTGSTTGLGARVSTGNLTLGSPQISSVTPTTGLRVGMLVENANFVSTTYVVSIVGNLVTVSTNSASTAAGATVVFHDAIIVQRGATTERFRQTGTTQSFIAAVNTSPGSTLVQAVPLSDVTWNYSSVPAESLPATGPVTVGLRSLNVGDGPFTVWATHGSEYTPALAEASEATGTSSAQETQENALFWSKSDQPEHVPIVNYVLIGDRAPILRIQPSRDVLWIFKADGLFKLTGYGADAGWQVDPVDAHALLIHPEAATSVADECFAVTSRGVLRIVEQGTEDVSSPRIGTDLFTNQQILAAEDHDTVERACWAAANTKEDELLFQFDTSGPVYVYNTLTQSFTTWRVGFTPSLNLHAATEDNRLWFADFTTPYRLWGELESGHSPTSLQAQYDGIHSITIDAISGETITIAASATWAPTVGDAIYDSTGGGYATVVSVASDTVFTVDSAVDLTTGSAQAFDAFTCVVEWAPLHVGAPHLPKLWNGIAWVFRSLQGVRTYDTGFLSSNSDTLVEIPTTFTRSESTRPRVSRFMAPIEHARSHSMQARLTITQALGRWALAGMAADGEVNETVGTRSGGS